MKGILIAILGAVLTVYGIVLCVISNFNFGVLMVLLLGAAVLCAGVFYSRIKKVTALKFFWIVKMLLILIVCAEAALVSFIAVYGAFDNVNYREDAVIVLGAGIKGDRVTETLKLRLDKAVEYHNINPEAMIVVSGGQGIQETVTEASAMEKYLVQNGVNQSKILKEEKATSTFENMKFSKEILDNYFQKKYSVVVITNNFHIFRGATVAKNAGFQNVKHMHAGLKWYNLMPCFLRESLAVMKMVVFG